MHESTRPRPDLSVAAFYIDDSCILFSEARQTALQVNATAGLIWSLLQDGLDRESIVAELVHAYSVEATQAPLFTRLALEAFGAHGLLAGGDAIGHAPPDPPPARRTPRPAGRFAVEQVYELSGKRIRLRYAEARHAALFHGAVAHLSASEIGPPAVNIDVLQGAERIEIFRDGLWVDDCATDRELAPILKGLVWTEAVHGAQFLFGFHAGVVAGRSGALLLPGQSGSGKSTLTALLVAGGLDYLSDEMALIEADTFTVKPLPLALCVKASGLEVLKPCFPGIDRLPMHLRADGKEVVYMPPPHAATASREVRAIVFPTFRQGADLRLTAMPRAEAIHRLLSQCLVAGGVLGRRDVGALIDWVSTKQCMTLAFGASADAARELRDVLDL